MRGGAPSNGAAPRDRRDPSPSRWRATRRDRCGDEGARPDGRAGGLARRRERTRRPPRTTARPPPRRSPRPSPPPKRTRSEERLEVLLGVVGPRPGRRGLEDDRPAHPGHVQEPVHRPRTACECEAEAVGRRLLGPAHEQVDPGRVDEGSARRRPPPARGCRRRWARAGTCPAPDDGEVELSSGMDAPRVRRRRRDNRIRAAGSARRLHERCALVSEA